MGKRELIIIAAAVCAALLTGLHWLSSGVMSTGAWGLHFSAEGQPPQGPVQTEQLKQYGAAYLGDPQSKVLYLTFDAGYENGQTARILQILEKHGAPATFFLVGDYIKRNPRLVRDMVAQGHTVGNHTMHHPDMRRLTEQDAFQRELTELESLFFQTTGQPLAKYYRPPQGLYTRENLQAAAELGYHTVFWSLAYADWDNARQPEHGYALSKLLGRTHNGAVVLLHSTSETNACILDTLLTRWEEMGYRFAPLEELFREP